VEAACAASDKGASVLVIESRPYLGYDICANQKLWLEPGEKPQTEITNWIFDGKRQQTPMKIKGLLDRVLLKRNIQFLTGSFPAELLVDQNGKPAGMTMVNRSGRQAIRAKVIVDATPYASLVRQLPDVLTEFKAGKKRASFTVIGGDLKKANDTIKGNQVPGVKYSKDYPVYQYDAKIDLKEDTYRAHSKAIHQVRSMVSDPKMVDHSEGLLVFPDHMIKTESNSDDPAALVNYLPRGFPNIFVLNAYAGIKNETVRHQLINSPYRLAPMGKKIGTAAAELASKTEGPNNIDYLASTSERPSSPSQNLRRAFVLMTARFWSSQEISYRFGVAGMWWLLVVAHREPPAALASARAGARTLGNRVYG
jgi:hypothetical protein